MTRTLKQGKIHYQSYKRLSLSYKIETSCKLVSNHIEIFLTISFTEVREKRTQMFLDEDEKNRVQLKQIYGTFTHNSHYKFIEKLEK